MIRSVVSVAAMAPYGLADVDLALTSLAQNESLRGPSPMARLAAEKSLRDGQLYPDPDWVDLRTAISDLHDVEPCHILCGAGSMELIGALIRAFSGPGDEVLGSAYGYLFLETACGQAGSRCLKAPEKDWCVSPDTVLAQVTDRTRIVFLCNPGNPTSTRIDNPSLVALRDGLRPDILLAIDQAYAEFDAQDHSQLLKLVARGNTVIFRTLSKAYGMAGFRVGWGLFPEAIGNEMRKLLNPNNVSGPAQAAATAAIGDQSYMLETVAMTATIRRQFQLRLRESGFVTPPSHSNFVLLPFDDAASADTAGASLRAEGFLARGLSGYGLAQCLRATIGSAEDMHRVADVITGDAR